MKLTVFTPTYNRKELLKRAYESLCAQTCRDFVWLIVDDGSEDGTGDVVKKWMEESDFPIRYAAFPNGGKMRAHNRGVELCETDWFVCLDSDDVLARDAVELIYSCREETKDKGVAGIVAHKGRNERETLYGKDFPEEGYSTLYGLYLKGFRGETTLVFKTEFLRAFPFPEIEGEKYVPEDYIYDKIDAKYTLFILPKILTVCELVSSGYTDSVKALKRDNPNAWYLYYRQRAGITPLRLLKWKYLGYYILYAKRCQKPVFRGGLNAFLVLTGYPFSWMIKWTGRD